MEFLEQLDSLIATITKKEELVTSIKEELQAEQEKLKEVAEDLYFQHIACNDTQLMFLFGNLHKTDRNNPNLLSSISISNVFTLSSDKSVTQDFRVSISQVKVTDVIKMFKNEPYDSYKALKTNISNVESETIDAFIEKCAEDLTVNLQEIIGKSKSKLKKHIKDNVILENLKKRIITSTNDFSNIVSVKDEAKAREMFAEWGIIPDNPIQILKNKQIKAETFLLKRELDSKEINTPNKSNKSKI